MSLDNAARGFSVVGVYRVHRRPRSRSEGRCRYTVIEYRVKGNSIFECGGEEAAADSKSMVYIPAGIDHAVRRVGEEELIVVHLECHGEDSDELAVYEGYPELEEIFLRLCAEWESCNAEWRQNRCTSILYAIFEAAQKTRLQKREGLPESIRPGVQMMHSAFRDPALGVSMLAEASGISEVYFRRIYKKHFGVSPIEGLLALRFAYAEDLLRSGYYTVKEVAALSGFSDVKYFRTTFSKRIGMSPSEYLRLRGGNPA